MSQSGGKNNNQTGEPLAKRGRSESSSSDTDAETNNDAVDNVLDEAATVQEEVEVLLEEEGKELAKIQDEYGKKRLDAYVRRNKILQTIPHFWTDVILKSPVADFLNDDDKNVMEYLSEVKFVESSNPRITLCFDENPYFTNKEIVKSFVVVDDGLESQEYSIDWTPGNNIAERSKTRVGGKGFGKQRRERNGKESFFLWFTNQAAFDENSMVDAIRELYQYPISFFNREDAEEVEADDHIDSHHTSGKISGVKGSSSDAVGDAGEEEEEYDDDDDDDEEEEYEDEEDKYEDEAAEENSSNGRSISPMLRQTGFGDFYDDDDDDNNTDNDDDGGN